MILYIKRIAQDIADLDPSGTDVFELLKVLDGELARLDPRDFLPAAQYDFARLKGKVQMLARATTLGYIPGIKTFGGKVVKCLDLYGGEGSQAVARSFAFIHDVRLRTIVERDYRELALILLPGGAWKSVVVMSGSILEAILYDLLTNDAAIQTRAINATTAPKGKDLANGKWPLHDLIKVSVELSLLPPARAASIDQILRDYRNFVHPKKEVRDAHPCTEAEAFLSKGALDSVCNHLTP